MDAALRDRWLAHALQRIAAAGLRSGAARSRVVELLARDGQCLIGVQAIVDRLRADGAPGSQASVYRVLDELHGLGLVTRSLDAQGVSSYEIADRENHHHHLIDDATGKVERLEDPALERAIVAAAKRAGFDLTGHEVVLRGTRVKPNS